MLLSHIFFLFQLARSNSVAINYIINFIGSNIRIQIIIIIPYSMVHAHADHTITTIIVITIKSNEIKSLNDNDRPKTGDSEKLNLNISTKTSDNESRDSYQIGVYIILLLYHGISCKLNRKQWTTRTKIEFYEWRSISSSEKKSEQIINFQTLAYFEFIIIIIMMMSMCHVSESRIKISHIMNERI